MSKKRKSRRILKTLIIILLLCLAAAVGVFFYLRQDQKEGRTGEADSMLVTRDSTAQVKRETIRQSAEGSGILEAAHEVTVTADHSVTVEKVSAQTGDLLKDGDLIASVQVSSIDDRIEAAQQELRDINTAISNTSRDGSSSLTAPVSGRVRRIFIQEGELLTDVTSTYGGVMEIAAAGELKVEFTPAQALATGTDVTVRFDNDGGSYEANGYILQMEDGLATAVFDDSADYDVDLEAQIYDKEDHLLGSGTIQSRHPYLVEGSYGKADEIRVSTGEWVDSGSTLLTRTETAYNSAYHELLKRREETMDDLQSLRHLKEEPVITASSEGILSSLLLQDAAPIVEGSPMYTLLLTDTWVLKAQVDELDIDGVQTGQEASIIFDAFDDREYTGTVSKVSSLGQNTGGVTTYTVSIDLEGKPEFKSAMSGTATIMTREEADALVVPVAAIQTRDEKKIVTVLSGDDLADSEDREVTLGLVNNVSAQVTEGLSEGETVLVIGTSRMEDMINMMRASRRSSAEGGN